MPQNKKSEEDESFPPLPHETVDVARSLFNIENVYLAIGDRIDHLFSDLTLADLDPSAERQAYTLNLLAMVTIFQYVEDMPDRLAVEAIRQRADWKYALHLPMDYPGIAAGSLYEFRRRLLLNGSGLQVFQGMLSRLAGVGLVNLRIGNRVDAKHILLAVCMLSRADELVQAMFLALEALAATRPELLRVVSLPHWYDRYYPVSSSVKLPRLEKDQIALVRSIGKDTSYLIEAILSSGEPDLAQIPEFRRLNRTWHQHFGQNEYEVYWREGC